MVNNIYSGLREDAVRQELADMRKRWQDAVSRTETLAADMHESTAPLLRQIKALQEEARVRATAWASAGERLQVDLLAIRVRFCGLIEVGVCHGRTSAD